MQIPKRKYNKYNNRLIMLSQISVEKIYALAAAALLVAPSAHAFLTDKSNQTTVMIGQGSTMAPVVVQEIKTVTPMQNRQISTINSGFNNSETNRGYLGGNTINTSGSNGSTYTNNTYDGGYNNNYNYQNPAYQIPAYAQNGKQTGNLSVLNFIPRSPIVLVHNLANGHTIYSKNTDSQKAIASITKLMTGVVVIDSGADLNELLTLTKEDIKGDINARTNLMAGDTLPRVQFLLMMLMKSENPAAKVLATKSAGGYYDFIQKMNDKAAELGMHNTHYADSSGLNPGNISTADDVLILMREIMTNPRYASLRNFASTPAYDFAIANTRKGTRIFNATSTNRYVRSGKYPISLSKTGHTNAAGHAVAMYSMIEGQPIATIILGASTSDQRWDDVRDIFDSLLGRQSD